MNAEYMQFQYFLLIYITTLFLCGCDINSKAAVDKNSEDKTTVDDPASPQMQIAHLTSGDEHAFESIRTVFKEHNPGYDLEFFAKTDKLARENAPRVVFVQTGGGTATLSSGQSSKVSVGDIILLYEKESMKVDSLLDLLVFKVPQAPNDSLPRFVRPDWDPSITDTPGGCATETGAYRRILLTWLGRVGPYLFHSLNAHRVRIMDSFTHYHPKEGGFDEFYLVQMVMPGAKIITGNRVDLVENYENLDPSTAKELLRETELQVGDLVYLPRGVIHRGVNGVLAQVITVPGFIPKSEIGVDFHLKRINEKFGLTGDKALPFNEEASDRIVIK